MKSRRYSRGVRLLLNGLAIVVVALSAAGCVIEERPAYYHGYYHHGYYDHGYDHGYYHHGYY